MASKRLTAFLDESGNTGANYLDPNQPVHVLGGWIVEDSKREGFARVVEQAKSAMGMPELKGGKMLGTLKVSFFPISSTKVSVVATEDAELGLPNSGRFQEPPEVDRHVEHRNRQREQVGQGLLVQVPSRRDELVDGGDADVLEQQLSEERSEMGPDDADVVMGAALLHSTSRSSGRRL